jgi:PKHD-type hydroxylase
LTREELTRIRETLAAAEFVDGRVTTGYRGKRVKNNQQVPRETPASKAMAEIVEKAMRRNRTFDWAMWPKRVGNILFSRYEPGMHYGSHVDNAIMGGADALRSDVSFTVFISDPTDYDGGELVIESSLGDQEIKLAAGEAVVYPATTVHRVAEVTRGRRLVAAGWVQCRVRDAAQREILYDLERIKRFMAEQTPTAAETDLAFKTQANLLRMWAEP